MKRALIAAASVMFFFGCALGASNGLPKTQPFFVVEHGIDTHGRKTTFDHVVEWDPGSFDVNIAPDFADRAPERIAVLPFVDRGSGNYVLNKVPVSFRGETRRAKWRWTHSNRLRHYFAAMLTQREFTVLNLYWIDGVLAAHGIDTADKLAAVPPQTLGKWLGADAVVYGEVTEYEAIYTGLVAGWKVALNIKMTASRDGETLVEARGDRYRVEVRPVIAFRDIMMMSALNLTNLRDIDLRRTEDEVCREIVLRIPDSPKLHLKLILELSHSKAGDAVEVPGSDVSPRAPLGGLAEFTPSYPGEGATQESEDAPMAVSPESETAKKAASQFAAGQLEARRKDYEDEDAPDDETGPIERVDGAQGSEGLAKATGEKRLTQASALDAAVSDPDDPPERPNRKAGTVAFPKNAASSGTSSNDDPLPTTAPDTSERFFIKEYGEMSHGRKTVLDRLIETDPNTFPFVVSPQFYRHPPARIAVLPFVDRGTGNYVLNWVDFPIHKKAGRAAWRWTIANRMRRYFTGYLAQREFVVANQSQVDFVLRTHGITDSAKLATLKPQQLGAWLGVDAVVYGEVSTEEAFYFFLMGGFKVGLNIRMVSTATGHTLIIADSGRYAVVLSPALTPTDMVINSTIGLTDLRDVKLRRAEDETCREIVMRIPEAAPLMKRLHDAAAMAAASDQLVRVVPAK